MANPEHLEQLKLGVVKWNEWRKARPDVNPDLSGANLSGIDLQPIRMFLGEPYDERVNLSFTNLERANLDGARLMRANLHHAQLHRASLNRAWLSQAYLNEADCSEADLSGSDLKSSSCTSTNLERARLVGATLEDGNFERATLDWANLNTAKMTSADFREATLKSARMRDADLSRANLRGAILSGAIFRGATLAWTNLEGTDLSHAAFDGTVFGYTKLARAMGLETCHHFGPSPLDFGTVLSIDPFPLPFLRGCGLSEPLIAYLPSLLNQPIQFYSCFISYSTKDQDFVDRLYADLQDNGVRCWFAPHDIKGCQKINVQIDEAIRVYDRLLLVLSPNSLASNWVEREIRKAQRRETEDKRRVLFPIRLCEFEVLRDWECIDASTGKYYAEDIR
jgi:uncharacterized protein YjbI with pentapeptide repeats